MKSKNLIYFDLFSGAGGFAQGLERAGFSFKKHFYSEVDKHALGLYRKQFPSAESVGDVQDFIVNYKGPRPNVVTFGSPCQGLSLAGDREGLERDSRSKLFFDAVEIIKIYEPDTFIFENVKGLFSSQNGKDFATVIKTFAELGNYDIEWQLVNTKWVLPQNRERIYIVGHLRGKTRREVFPITEKDIKNNRQTSETKDSITYWKNSTTGWTNKVKKNAPTLTTQTDIVRQTLVAERGRKKGGKYVQQLESREDNISNTITNVDKDNLVTGFAVKSGNKAGVEIAHKGDYIDITAPNSNRRARVKSNYTGTLTSSHEQAVVTCDTTPSLRRLTAIEKERLQGFCDNWSKYGINEKGEEYEIPETGRTALMGNAVTVDIVHLIASKLAGKKFIQKQRSWMKKEKAQSSKLKGISGTRDIKEINTQYNNELEQLINDNLPNDHTSKIVKNFKSSKTSNKGMAGVLSEVYYNGETLNTQVESLVVNDIKRFFIKTASIVSQYYELEPTGEDKYRVVNNPLSRGDELLMNLGVNENYFISNPKPPYQATKKKDKKYFVTEKDIEKAIKSISSNKFSIVESLNDEESTNESLSSLGIESDVFGIKILGENRFIGRVRDLDLLYWQELKRNNTGWEFIKVSKFDTSKKIDFIYQTKSLAKKGLIDKYQHLAMVNKPTKTPKGQSNINREVERILNDKNSNGEYFTKQDIELFAQYEPTEGRDRLYSFFTPIWVSELMYQLAEKHGYKKGGNILEQACGTGNVLEVLQGKGKVEAFETNPINFQIAKLRNPQATIYNQYFETAFMQPPKFRTVVKTKWLNGYPFDLVIGNPPYGQYSGKYASYFKGDKMHQLETFFMKKGLELLKKGGLLVYITGSNFMRNGSSYNIEKEVIGKMAELVEAYRLPKVFKNTQVPTDIIVLRKL